MRLGSIERGRRLHVAWRVVLDDALTPALTSSIVERRPSRTVISGCAHMPPSIVARCPAPLLMDPRLAPPHSAWASGRDVTRVEPGAFLIETSLVELQVAPSRASKNKNLVLSLSDFAGWVEGATTSWITAGFPSIRPSARPMACLPPRSRN